MNNCTRIRWIGSPMSRSTPTVARRSSTSMIVSARRKTVEAMIVTIAIARWKRSMTMNGPADPAAPLAGCAVDARHARADVARERARVRRVHERDVDAPDVLAAGRHAGLARQRQQIGQVQPHLARDGAEAHGIGRRLVDPGDAERPRPAAVGRRGEPHEVAGGEVLLFRELARDQD